MSRIIFFPLLLFAFVTNAAPPQSPPGLTLTFTQNNKTDTRTNRLLALLVPAGSAPTPFLSPGTFHAKFEGYLEIKIRGDYKFSAIGNGKLKLTINDKPLLDSAGDLAKSDEKPVSLKKGKNKIVAEYDSPATGDSLIRIYWSSEGDFAPEPLDPRLLVHDPSDALTTGTRLREGRLLFADLHCIRCHTADQIDPKTGMPELAEDAPNLQAVGSRLNQKWLARWIADPKSLRPDTAMPNVFHAKADHPPQQASDIAAYLATLGPKAPEPKLGDPVMGGRIVARLGCIGCHTLPDRDPATPDPRGRISWHNVKAKYQPDALIAFLKKPEEHFAWIRMPNFHFTDDEARNVAAYLLKNSKDLEAETPNGDAANGQKLVQSSGCLSCHTIAGQNEFKAPGISDLAKGCLAKDPSARGKAPDFGLDEPMRDALVAFLSTDRASLKQDAPPEFAERQISELGCINCHSRDRTPDAWDDLVKETESLSKGDTVDVESSAGGKGLPGEPAPGTGDQQRPPLTWVGEKLKPNWMADFIAGKIDYKPRAWMRARMPSFPARAQGITVGLALEHAVPTTLPPKKPQNADLAKIGKQLVSRNGGLSCVQCHGIGSIGPIAPFEAPSINFKYVNERLRKDYYDRWMRDPIRLVPTTKMPKFQNDGKTPLTDILDGDADKQFDAIWEYLKSGRKIVHPEQ